MPVIVTCFILLLITYQSIVHGILWDMSYHGTLGRYGHLGVRHSGKFGIILVCQCFVCPVCVSVLPSHTVLSELYQEKLVTEDDVERMIGEGGDLSDRVVNVQCTKPPEVVTRTADVLDKYGFNEATRQLRGW